MAWPVIATNWRALPEILSFEGTSLVDPRAPGQIASALERLLTQDDGAAGRERFLERYTLDRHLEKLAATISLREKAVDSHDRSVILQTCPSSAAMIRTSASAGRWMTFGKGWPAVAPARVWGRELPDGRRIHPI